MVIKNSPTPAKRRCCNAAFRAEALRLASESRSTQAAARGANLDPATAAELRQLRALARRQVQELDILKKLLPVVCYKRRLSVTDKL